jgi:hypothetical protein
MGDIFMAGVGVPNQEEDFIGRWIGHILHVDLEEPVVEHPLTKSTN